MASKTEPFSPNEAEAYRSLISHLPLDIRSRCLMPISYPRSTSLWLPSYSTPSKQSIRAQALADCAEAGSYTIWASQEQAMSYIQSRRGQAVDGNCNSAPRSEGDMYRQTWSSGRKSATLWCDQSRLPTTYGATSWTLFWLRNDIPIAGFFHTETQTYEAFLRDSLSVLERMS